MYNKTGFEPGSSGARSDRSANCAIATSHLPKPLGIVIKNRRWYASDSNPELQEGRRRRHPWLIGNCQKYILFTSKYFRCSIIT